MGAGQLVRKLTRGRFSRPSNGGWITVGDHVREFRVNLDPGLPEDAYRQLFDLDLPSPGSGCGTLTWDGNTWDYR